MPLDELEKLVFWTFLLNGDIQLKFSWTIADLV
jgi:hypothetical protein